MAELRSLDIWIDCPVIKYYIGIAGCRICPNHVSEINNTLQCKYEEK